MKFRGDSSQVTAAQFNSMLQAAERERARPFNVADYASSADRPSQSLVRVEAHANLQAFYPVGLGDPRPYPSAEDRRLKLSAGLAFVTVAPEQGRPFAILQEPLQAGRVGWAVVAGLTVAFVKVANVADPCKAAGIIEGELRVMEGGPAPIVYRQNGTGFTPCVIHLSPSPPRFIVGTTAAAIAPGAIGKVVPMGAGVTDPRYDAKNEATKQIASGAKVGITWDDLQALYVVSMEFC